MRPIRVLFVSPDAVLCGRIRQGLEGLGYRMFVCSNGDEVEHVIEHNQVDLVILTVEQEGMNGFRVCRRLREASNPTELPIVMYAPSDSHSWRIASFRAGANIYAHEPILFDRLDYILRLLASYKRSYQRAVPSADALRLMGGIADTVSGATDGTALAPLDLDKSMRWTDLLTQTLTSEEEPQHIVHEGVKLTLALAGRYGSIGVAVDKLAGISDGTSLYRTFAKTIVSFACGDGRDEEGEPTAGGVCATMLLFLDELHRGATTGDAIASLRNRGVCAMFELDALESVVVADELLESLG